MMNFISFSPVSLPSLSHLHEKRESQADSPVKFVVRISSPALRSAVVFSLRFSEEKPAARRL